MKILALELSTARGSLAWLNTCESAYVSQIENVDLVVREWPNDRKNSALFFENLQNVRRKFGVPDTIVIGLMQCRVCGDDSRSHRTAPRVVRVDLMIHPGHPVPHVVVRERGRRQLGTRDDVQRAAAILVDALEVHEVVQFVLDDRPAEIAAH